MTGRDSACPHLDTIEVSELPTAVDGREEWSWCFADDLAMLTPAVTGTTRIPPSPMVS